MTMMDLPKLLVTALCLGYGILSIAGEDLRLVGDNGPYEGRLEVEHAGEWGSICIDGWDINHENMIVACRQLGFSRGYVRKVTGDKVGQGRFWMDDVVCRGDEAELSDCDFNGWNVLSCNHASNHEVYLICKPELCLRLTGGKDLYEGHLEVYTYEGDRVSACSLEWSPSASEVACRQMGFGGGIHTTASETGRGTIAFWDRSPRCVGNESRLDDCKFIAVACPVVMADNLIHLSCQPVIDGVLRLAAGKVPFEGRLEVWYGGEWGTVCDNYWTEYPQNAEVACRQLGLSGGSFRNVQQLVNVAKKFWIDGLQCQNNERRIYDCPFNGWGNETCYHSKLNDVFLMCEPHRDGAIRLVGWRSQFEGRLEINVAGEWGGVCISQWHKHKLNAHVACRQLGLTGGTFRHLMNGETGMGGFWMDNVECLGDETNLDQCSFTGWGVPTCDGVYLSCIPNNGDIQLVEGRDAYQGRVIMYLGRQWTYVCGASWSSMNAEVTCRQLGLNSADVILASDVRENNTSDLHFDCNTGDEEHLLACAISYGTCQSGTVAFVQCYAPVTYGSTCTAKELCVGNAICQLSDGSMKCICEDEENVYWDPHLEFCMTKSQYGQACVLSLSSCESNSKCQANLDVPRCACENKTVWRSPLKTCLHLVGYNETCVYGGCESNMMCLQSVDNTSRCGCREDYYWDNIGETCNIRLEVNTVCNTTVVKQCMSNLRCLWTSSIMSYTCMCAGNYSYWDPNAMSCEKRRSIDEACSPGILDMCDSNLLCMESNSSSLCLCTNDTFWNKDVSSCNARLWHNTTCNPSGPNPCVPGLGCRNVSNQNSTYKCLCVEENVYWDNSTHTCLEQSPYNETCSMDVPNMCYSNLACLDTHPTSRCLCMPMTDLYWDPGNSSCTTKSTYREICSLDIPDMCYSNLMCVNTSECTQCLCSPDQFWDNAQGSCMAKRSYGELCLPQLTQCMDGLVCHVKSGELIYKCVCPGYGNLVWASSTRRCQSYDNLIAVYIPDSIGINDAVTFCEEEYSGGKLATEDDLTHLFVSCTEFVDDIWLTLNISSDWYTTDDACLIFDKGIVTNCLCSLTHPFVCIIHEKGVTETCRDFPEKLVQTSTPVTMVPQPNAIERPVSGLLWWILAVALTLMVIGVLFMAIIFRRRESGYNQWKRRKSLLGTSKVVHNEWYNPRTRDKDDAPKSPRKSKIRKSLFTSSKRKKSSVTPPSTSSGGENPYAVPKKRSMKRGNLNSSSSSVSMNSSIPSTPNVENLRADKSGGSPQSDKGDNSSETQFNFLYDSFLKSVANTNRNSNINVTTT